MRIAISTNWNSHLHESGDAMLDEIAALGFDTVELGYALSFGQADAVEKRVKSGEFRVCSVHAFCPNPVPGGRFGPEPFSICDADDLNGYRHGIEAVLSSARFAARMGARKLVLHAGRAPVFRAANRLSDMVRRGKRATPAYARRLARFQERRFKKSHEAMDTLVESLETLLPQLEEIGVVLCLENLPSGDAVPNEAEMETLLRIFDGAPLACWHDIGHGQIRHELGLVHHAGLVRRMASRIGGFHVHDVMPPLQDHAMPPGGLVDFSMLSPFVEKDVPLVLEPAAGLPAQDISRALEFLRGVWGIAP
ncbi:MAG: sugar phosphate isomerase/epimerase [Kiritimatiellae bacterium]|nr:sugar phosphate isomerase/epimerase [Kiritimatiellia bacterium]